MVTPDYKTFLQLSRDATLIPVAKTLSADMLTPVGAFQSIAAGQKYAFLLESVEGGEKIGRYTFVGTQPRTVLTARGRELTIRRGSREERQQGNVIEVAAGEAAAIPPGTHARTASVYRRRRGLLRLRHGAPVRAPAGDREDRR